MKVDDMPAGRELDARVAALVMYDLDEYHDKVKRYSTDIAAAWEVVESLVNTRTTFELELDGPRRCVVLFHRFDEWLVNGSADTVPLAICRAALKAVGVESDD